MTDTKAPNSLCHVPVPDGVSECGISELPSSIHSDDETEHDTFFVQTCVEEVEKAEYVAPLKSLLSMRLEDPVDEECGYTPMAPAVSPAMRLPSRPFYPTVQPESCAYPRHIPLFWVRSSGGR